MSDGRNYDNAYKSYLDPMVWTQLGPGQWQHAGGARLDVSGKRPANAWTLTVGQNSYSGTTYRHLDPLLGQHDLCGVGGRRKPYSREP
jgi:hypothetical protein